MYSCKWISYFNIGSRYESFARVEQTLYLPLSSCFQPWGFPDGATRRLPGTQSGLGGVRPRGQWQLDSGRSPSLLAAWAASSKRVTGGFSEGSSRKEHQMLEAWLAGSRIFVLTFPALSPCSVSHLLCSIGDAPK